MKNKQTIFKRYVALAKERQEAPENTPVDELQKMDDRFWKFVDSYLLSFSATELRTVSDEAGIADEYRAFY